MMKNQSYLLPDRHPNQDFFVCDILDAVPKDDMASMEHPIFSLSTRPDTKVRVYEHNNNRIQIAPSVLGLATIHDKDILIYVISQLVAKMNQGGTPNRTVRLKAYDLLVSTNRQTSGRGYHLLKDALERLAGTRVTTDILTNGQREIDGFGLIAFACLFPIISVLAYAQLSEWYSKRKNLMVETNAKDINHI